MDSMMYDDWDRYDAHEQRVANMEPGQFVEAMELQKKLVADLLESASENDLNEKIVRAPGAGDLPLGTAIMRTSYAWTVAYRHELFLRAKASGATAINTANNWGGIDWTPPKKEDAKQE
jgi:hypothetical protein